MRHLERHQEAQNREGRREEITDLFRRAAPCCGTEPISDRRKSDHDREGRDECFYDWLGGGVSLRRF